MTKLATLAVLVCVLSSCVVHTRARPRTVRWRAEVLEPNRPAASVAVAGW